MSSLIVSPAVMLSVEVTLRLVAPADARAARYGSAMNCERPIQFWVVLPRSAGVTVMLVLVATGWPFTYSVPVWPASVTATCDQVFSGSVPGPAITSPPPLGVASANRSGPPPALSVRNMKLLVPVPKSNTRDQAELADGLTHGEMVKSCSPLTMPLGRLT